jgi:type II secretory pathway predicted ATPase ExeA
MSYCQFYGFKTEPFTQEIATKNLLRLPAMVTVKERLDYVMNGGVFIVTGEVGSGKSTSLRWAQNNFHPSQYLFVNMVASGGSIIEFYRQLCWGIDINIANGTRTTILTKFKKAVFEITASKKQKVAVIIDEAHLLRPEIFAELHTITQFNNDSKNVFALVMAGQPNLIDKLTYRASQPIASRVIARTHLSNLDESQIAIYLEHHLNIAGTKKQLFSTQAMTAIYQGSAGILRKINHLARGGLIAAATDKQDVVNSEHIRIAASELI